MSKKMIQLDPKFMSFSKKGNASKTLKKREKLKKSKITNTGSIRKQLLNKIKDYQKKNEDALDEQSKPKDPEEDFEGEFNKSLQFLNNLSTKKKNTKRQKKDRKKNKSSDKKELGASLETINVSTELPRELMEDAQMNIPARNTSRKKKSQQPSYSCLKNGSRPTYREWKRNTQKNMEGISSPNDTTALSERELALQKVKDNFKASVKISQEQHEEVDNNKITLEKVIPSTPKVSIEMPTELKTEKELTKDLSSTTLGENSVKNTPPTPIKREHRIKTKKYKLGKDKTRKFVGVLIKNRDTRKKISKEKDNLKKKSILEVKNYLKKYNLLKTGSDAPPDVLRTMYEQAILAGEINNKGKDNLLHNFYNK